MPAAALTLADARKAGILTTPKGKVALVSTATTFKVNAGANDAFDEAVPARPGISTLRTAQGEPGQCRAVGGGPRAGHRTRLAAGAGAEAGRPRYHLRRRHLSPGDDTSGPRIAYEMELYDHTALLKAVREAKAAADLVVFTIHAHESPTGLDDDTPAPPDFLLKLFHQCVDAGADVIQGGGPHSLRGIEIYKGKPILYGMGLFMLKAQIKAMQETVLRMWPDLDGHPPKPVRVAVVRRRHAGKLAGGRDRGGRLRHQGAASPQVIGSIRST
jgi:poly-gamma-glutamate capsule biosynthesis protein CapA/YwtB (metallophosphatase superfamily)